MRRTTSSGSEGDRTNRPSADNAMHNRTGPGGGGYSSSSSNYYTESPSQQRQSPSQQHQDRWRFQCNHRICCKSIWSEVLETTGGEQRILLERLALAKMVV
jgi:hypothetical protein